MQTKTIAELEAEANATSLDYDRAIADDKECSTRSTWDAKLAARAAKNAAHSALMTARQVACEAKYQGTLKVWTAGGEEWCIASTSDWAAHFYEKEIGHRLGEDGEPAGGDTKEAAWTEEPAGKVFKYRNEDGTVTERTCAEWAWVTPAGYFASANE